MVGFDKTPWPLLLTILNNFAGKDMPGRQTEMQDCVNRILAAVDPANGGKRA